MEFILCSEERNVADAAEGSEFHRSHRAGPGWGQGHPCQDFSRHLRKREEGWRGRDFKRQILSI